MTYCDSLCAALQVQASIAEALTDVTFGSQPNHKEAIRRGVASTMFEIATSVASASAQVHGLLALAMLADDYCDSSDRRCPWVAMAMKARGMTVRFQRALSRTLLRSLISKAGRISRTCSSQLSYALPPTPLPHHGSACLPCPTR